MNLLLDTHIWLWSILEPHRLSRRVTKQLSNPANKLWLSPVSIWEAMLLARKGRIRIPVEFGDWIEGALTSVPVNEAPFTVEVAQALPAIILPHEDPADLFLAASAKTFALTLVTADRNLINASQIQVLANR